MAHHRNHRPNHVTVASVTSAPAGLTPTDLNDLTHRMKEEGYVVFPSTYFDAPDATPNILNAQLAHAHHAGHSAHATHLPLISSSGIEVFPDNIKDTIGTPGYGYIQWGMTDDLPNKIALFNSMLVYTALPVKFNIDTACGIGIAPMYRFHTSIGCNENAEEIDYEHAGSYLRAKIAKLRQKLFDLIKDHVAAPAENAAVPAASTSAPVPDASPSGSATVSRGASTTPIHVHTPGSSTAATPALPQFYTPAQSPEGDPSQTDPTDDGSLNTDALHHPDGQGYRRFADTVLDDMIKGILADIAAAERDLKVWGRTYAALKQLRETTNLPQLTHDLFTDLIQFGICFPEFQLSQNGTRQPDSRNWKPRITAISHDDALTCRLEKKDPLGVSRFIYRSNRFLDPQHKLPTTVDGSASAISNDLTAIPALDPACPTADLRARILAYRSAAASAADNLANAESDPDTDPDTLASLQADAAKYDIHSRPTRYVFPVAYRTAGRPYYPQPAYWSIYNDIYDYASTIIRDRATRKANESMFSYVIYVHSTYLQRLTNQINAQKTEEEKEAIRSAEIKRIKKFIANKENNGQVLAACSFTGTDGKDHDAFRIERIEYNNKTQAEADKTEISDISGIIMFGFECHPDLIGATPGGASSSGGTYQREMLLIKQGKMSPTQQLVLQVFNTYRDFNGLDPHLSWKIKQQVLTTLDASKTGIVEE